MPYVQVHTSRRPSSADRRILGRELAKIYARCMQTSHRIVNVAFLLLDEGDVARYDADNDDAQEMLVVTCNIRAGRPDAMIEALGREITAACSLSLGVPEGRIAIYVTEHAAAFIYRDGGRAPDWAADEADSPTMEK